MLSDLTVLVQYFLRFLKFWQSGCSLAMTGRNRDVCRSRLTSQTLNLISAAASFARLCHKSETGREQNYCSKMPRTL